MTELNVYFGKKIPVGFYAHLGYKTAGYIEGERLNKGLIMRLGLSIRQKKSNEVNQEVITF